MSNASNITDRSIPFQADVAPKTARLALADGTLLHGRAFGAEGARLGEVVFNTSMTGYQEIITDPSYAGQIVVMTAPQIGNTGMNDEDDEAARPFLSGFLVRDLCTTPSNWRAQYDLCGWLAERGVVGINGIDTRALTRRLRANGALKGIVCTDAARSDASLVEEARAWPGLDGVDLVQTVTCTAPYEWSEPTAAHWMFPPIRQPGETMHVVVYDFGVKRGMLARLVAAGCRVTVVPAHTSAADVLARKPSGILLSNGPGDPAAVGYAVDAVKALTSANVPIYGICLGHQILGLAFGGRTYRLKFGHHGGNQPVKHLASGRVEISAHNHNFAVEPSHELEQTHVNLNDGCCEGLKHRNLPIASVQYHPEACPGPHDADPFFDAFVDAMRKAPVEVAR